MCMSFVHRSGRRCFSSREARNDFQSVPLTIRAFSGEVVSTLTVEAQSSVGMVKSQLAKQLGHSVANLRLVHGSTMLSDYQILDDLGPPDELTLIRQDWKGTDKAFQEGDLVQLHHDGNLVFDSLKGTMFPWMDAMNDMLGRTFVVRSVPGAGLVGLPCPRQTGLANTPLTAIFPDAVVREGEKLKPGDVVRVSESLEIARASFQTCRYAWHPEMSSMLGKAYSVLEVPERGVVVLAAAEEAEDQRWHFPVCAVSKPDDGCADAVQRKLSVFGP